MLPINKVNCAFYTQSQQYIIASIRECCCVINIGIAIIKKTGLKLLAVIEQFISDLSGMYFNAQLIHVLISIGVQ
jgi:hypothetical protein